MQWVIKVPMKWKLIAAFLKGFLKKVRMTFVFGISFFHFRDVDVFVLCKLGNLFATNIVKYWIKKISGNIEELFFKLGTRTVYHKRNKIDTLGPIHEQKIYKSHTLSSLSSLSLTCKCMTFLTYPSSVLSLRSFVPYALLNLTICNLI